MNYGGNFRFGQDGAPTTGRLPLQYPVETCRLWVCALWHGPPGPRWFQPELFLFRITFGFTVDNLT
jgi:hypothetical protein